MLRERFEQIVRADPDLMQLLRAGRALGLPQWRVVAGCLYQTVWNVLTGRPRGLGIRDYDLIYFDAADLSVESEKQVEARVHAAVPGLRAPVDVHNQARVHLWFEGHFGIAYAPLRSADEAIERYATMTHAVGIRLEADDRFDIFTPFGLGDLFDMVIRPNPVLPNKPTHEKKAQRARGIWPEVTVIPWD